MGSSVSLVALVGERKQLPVLGVVGEWQLHLGEDILLLASLYILNS